MSLPITARIKRIGTKKACGCPSNCNCGKTPAKFNKELRAEANDPTSDMNAKFRKAILAPKSPADKMYGTPAKMHCYGKKK